MIQYRTGASCSHLQPAYTQNTVVSIPITSVWHVGVWRYRQPCNLFTFAIRIHTVNGCVKRLLPLFGVWRYPTRYLFTFATSVYPLATNVNQTAIYRRAFLKGPRRYANICSSSISQYVCNTIE